MQEFVNRVGMKCKINLTDGMTRKIQNITEEELVYGIISEVQILPETYTRKIDNTKNKATFNRVKIIVECVNEEFELRDIRKFLTINKSGDKNYDLELKNMDKKFIRKIEK
jgi:hypothetical protein